MDIMITWCAKSHATGHYFVKADWDDQDLQAAIRSALRQLHLIP